MRLNFYLLLCLFPIWTIGISQQIQLTDQAQISVLTCGTGDQLYSSFGHSAFRVQDPNHGIDIVYNYGTFDFDTPNFYLKFAGGKLLYSLSRQHFANFLYTYQLENRWVKEQLLDLKTDDKNKLFGFLEENYKPENRYYQYDFIYENCSTKIPEVLNSVLGNSLVFRDDHLSKDDSFRELIQSYLYWNSWASFGIDIALGSVIDQQASSYESMFLPAYVLAQLNNASVNDQPLVLRQRTILDLDKINPVIYFTTSPLFWILLSLVFTMTITFIDFRNGSRSRWLDFSLHLISGFVGLVIMLLWFFSDYAATADNFNIIWAIPANVVVAFYLWRKKPVASWLPKYNAIVLSLLAVVPLLWLMGIQSFPPLIVLVLLMLAVRYLFLRYYFKKVNPINNG